MVFWYNLKIDLTECAAEIKSPLTLLVDKMKEKVVAKNFVLTSRNS